MLVSLSTTTHCHFILFSAIPKLNGRETLEANEKTVERVLRSFEDLGISMDRQQRAWEKFEAESKQLDADLTAAQVLML